MFHTLYFGGHGDGGGWGVVYIWSTWYKNKGAWVSQRKWKQGLLVAVGWMDTGWPQINKCPLPDLPKPLFCFKTAKEVNILNRQSRPQLSNCFCSGLNEKFYLEHKSKCFRGTVFQISEVCLGAYGYRVILKQGVESRTVHQSGCNIKIYPLSIVFSTLPVFLYPIKCRHEKLEC